MCLFIRQDLPCSTHHLAPNPLANDVHALKAQLSEAARSRRAQLEALPPDSGLVAAAHKANVSRILGSILAVQEQLAAGTFGTSPND